MLSPQLDRIHWAVSAMVMSKPIGIMTYYSTCMHEPVDQREAFTNCFQVEVIYWSMLDFTACSHSSSLHAI